MDQQKKKDDRRKALVRGGLKDIAQAQGACICVLVAVLVPSASTPEGDA